LRAVVAGALLGTTRELRERDERDVQLLCDRFEAARDLRDLLMAAIELPNEVADLTNVVPERINSVSERVN
jgi:hypothetical protein